MSGLHEEGTLIMAHTRNVLRRTASWLVKSVGFPHFRFGVPSDKVSLAALSMTVGAIFVSGCANNNGYNGQPCYPYNAYPYAPQPQYGVPGSFQPGGVYPAPNAAGAPIGAVPGAPIGSPGVMPNAPLPAGMAPMPGYNNMPAYNGQLGGGPGQPFVGS